MYRNAWRRAVRGSNRMFAAILIVALVLGGTGYALARSARSPGASLPSSPPAIGNMETGGTVDATPAPFRTDATPAATPAATPKAKKTCTVPDVRTVNRAPQDLAAPGPAIVNVGALNLRDGPSTDCPVVGSLGFGMQVQIGDKLLEHGDYLWRKVKTPAGTGYTIASPYNDMPEVAPATVPVLMYHHIDQGTSQYHVSPATLEAQLNWLKQNGYVSITPRDLYNARYQGMTLPAKPVMLTIDDGDPTNMTFKRLLDRYGFRGVYFLPNYTELTGDQIRELANSGQVCGHTVSHPFLNQLGYDAQYAEIVNNKTWLEEVIGRPVQCFGYPFGEYNSVTDQVMAVSGYRTAYNAWGGMAVISPNANPYHILREGVDWNLDLATFISMVKPAG